MQKAYKGLINRIAITLVVNSALFVLLSTIFYELGSALVGTGEISDLADTMLRIIECIVYFASFTLPIIVFSAMTRRAGEEIKPFRDGGKLFSGVERTLAIFISLGAILAAAYVNFFVVSIFPNYSDFTGESFWAVSLDKPYQILLYIVSTAVVPALCEELLFRGTVCKALMPYGKRSAVLISAVLFSLMHTNIEQTLYTFVGGLLLGWIYVNTESVIYPILLHFINNSVSVAETIMIEKLSQDTAFYAVNALESAVFALSVVSFICFIIMRKKKESIAVQEAVQDGYEVAPLKTGEKVKGFFTVGMIIYIAYCVAMSVYYIYLSFK